MIKTQDLRLLEEVADLGSFQTNRLKFETVSGMAGVLTFLVLSLLPHTIVVALVH